MREQSKRVVLALVLPWLAGACSDSPTAPDRTPRPLTLRLVVENTDGLATLEWVAVRIGHPEKVVTDWVVSEPAQKVEGEVTIEEVPGTRFLVVEFRDLAGEPFGERDTLPNNYRFSATGTWRGADIDLGSAAGLVEPGGRLAFTFTLE